MINMKIWLSVCFLLIITIGSANSQSDAPVESEIERINQAFMKYYSDKDAKALAELYTKDASIFQPNQPRVNGRNNIEAMWQEVIDSGVTDLVLITNEIQDANDIAHEVGFLTLKYPNKDGVITDMTGRYIAVLLKRNGNWKIHRYIWNYGPIDYGPEDDGEEP